MNNHSGQYNLPSSNSSNFENMDTYGFGQPNYHYNYNEEEEE